MSDNEDTGLRDFKESEESKLDGSFNSCLLLLCAILVIFDKPYPCLIPNFQNRCEARIQTLKKAPQVLGGYSSYLYFILLSFTPCISVSNKPETLRTSNLHFLYLRQFFIINKYIGYKIKFQYSKTFPTY